MNLHKVCIFLNSTRYANCCKKVYPRICKVKWGEQNFSCIPNEFKYLYQQFYLCDKVEIAQWFLGERAVLFSSICKYLSLWLLHEKYALHTKDTFDVGKIIMF